MCSSHCSRMGLASLAMLRDVIKDSRSNCPCSFSPVDALLSSSAKLLSSVKLLLTGELLVRVQQWR